VKKAADAVAVRNALLETFAAARTTKVDAQRLKGRPVERALLAGPHSRHTDRIASTLARYVRFRRSYDTLDASTEPTRR